jgi:hypothetical protein
MIPPETVKAAADAARVASGIDSRVMRSIADSFPKLDPSIADAFSRNKTEAIVGDLACTREALKVLDSFRPIVAPQIVPQLAEVLGRINQQNAASAAAVLQKIGSKPFSFAKTFDGIDVEKIIWPELSKAIESVQGLGLPKSYGATIAEALRARPSVEPGEFTPQVEATAEEAIVLAGDDDVAEIVDDETVVARIAGMSPEKRRALALDVLVLVGACVVLAAWLAQADLKDPRGAGIALAWAASLIRVYWRLNDKL